MWKFVLLLCVLAVSADYSGHKLFEVRPQNEGHLKLLWKLADEGKIDVWSASEEKYEVMIAPSLNLLLSAQFRKTNLPFTVSAMDIQNDIEVEASRLAKRSRKYDYKDFNDLETTNKEILRLAESCMAYFSCIVDYIGFSIERRPIMRLQFTQRGTQKKAVWLDATTHAREWLTTTTILKIMRHMIDNYETDKEVKHLVDTYDWHFLPVINPDGYNHSWTSGNRMYRKNMRVNKNPWCPGIDLNRNADHAWATQGSSSQECSQTYHGSKPASEPETIAVQNEILKQSDSIIQYISLHSYGNYWLIPFGHIDPVTRQCYKSKDDPEMLRVANAAANAIEKVDNTKWKRGPTCTTIYPASGGVVDYSKSKGGIMYGAVPEVRGPSFVVPPSAIPISFKEIWAGLVASMTAIENKGV